MKIYYTHLLEQVIKNKFLIHIYIILFSSCVEHEKTKVIANVYEKKLYLSEIINSMPNHTKDSAYFIQNYTNNWIMNQLLVHHAEINLSKDLKNYKKQIDEYRSSLLIYAYQQELLNQNLDTTINDSDIENYYNNYKDQFTLNKSIFKGRFIIVEKTAPKLKFLDKSYKSSNPEKIDKLVNYCQQFAKEYYLKDDEWQYLTIFNQKLPSGEYIEKNILHSNHGKIFEDNRFRYYLYVKEYQEKGTIAPISIKRNEIKNTLLNRKKIDYLDQVEEKLYQNALALKKIKIYK